MENISWNDKIATVFLQRDVKLIDKNGKELGIARQVEVPCKVEADLQALILYFIYKRKQDNFIDPRLDDIIYMSLKCANIISKGPSERLKLFLQDLESENPYFTNYHIVLAASLLGAVSVAVTGFKVEYKLRLGPRLHI